MREPLDEETLRATLEKVLELPDFQTKLSPPSFWKEIFQGLKTLFKSWFPHMNPEDSETAILWMGGFLLVVILIGLAALLLYALLKQSPICENNRVTLTTTTYNP